MVVVFKLLRRFLLPGVGQIKPRLAVPSKTPSAIDLVKPRQDDPPVAKTNEVSSRLPDGLVGGLQILGILGLTTLAIIFARSDGNGTRTASFPPPSQAGDLSVRVIQPPASASTISLSASGSVAARTYVELMPQVSGRIVELSSSMKAGGSFAANESLLRIDPSDFQLQVDQAQADIQIASANLMLQQARSDAAKKNYAIVNPGAEVPTLVALLPQIAQAEAQLAAARARLEVAELSLSRTNFSLPFAGRITESSADLGQMLTSGKSFGQAYSLNSVEVAIPISPSDLVYLEPAEGRRVLISYAGQELEGRIERVSSEFDQRSRFARLYVPMNAYPEVQPGFFVETTLIGPEVGRGITLPEAAVQPSGNVLYIRDGVLVEHRPEIRGRNSEGLIIDAFDYADGVVLGAVSDAAVGDRATPYAESSP